MALKQSYMLGEMSKDNQLEHFNKLVHHRHGLSFRESASETWQTILIYGQEGLERNFETYGESCGPSCTLRAYSFPY